MKTHVRNCKDCRERMYVLATAVLPKTKQEDAIKAMRMVHEAKLKQAQDPEA